MSPNEIAGKINKAIFKARKDYLRMTIQQERLLFDIYKDSARKINDEILRYTVAGKVPPVRLTALLKMVDEEMAALRVKVNGNIGGGMNKAIKFGGKVQAEALKNIVPPKFKAALPANWATINKKALETLLKTPLYGFQTSKRVWGHISDLQFRLRQTIAVNIAQGRASTGLANDIRTFMTYTGKRGRGIYKSEYKNAMRLARTEMARAYGEGTIRYGKSKRWITGYIWHRVPGGESCAICDELDGEFFPKEEVPPFPAHPQCMCYLESVLDEEKLFGER